MSVAQQVLDDLSQALQADRVQAFEAGRLAEREAAFDAHQEAYQRGVADEKARLLKLLEDNNTCDGGISRGTCTCTAIGILEEDGK